jgi:hypothetical protein
MTTENKIAVNQLALSQVLDRFAALNWIEFPGLDVVQLRAVDRVLDVACFDPGLDGAVIGRPFVGVSVSLPCSPGELAVEVDLGVLACLLKPGDDAGFDKTTIEIGALDDCLLSIEQKRPGGAPGFEATVAYELPAPWQEKQRKDLTDRDWAPILATDAGRLAERLDLVLPAMASEKGDRAELACILLKSGKLHATDGHRLHVAGVEPSAIHEPLTIPAALARELPALLAGFKILEIETDQRAATLVRFTTLFNDLYPFEIVLGAGGFVFPDVVDIMQEERPIAVDVNGPALASALKRAIEVGGDVVLDVGDTSIKVRTGTQGLNHVTMIESVQSTRGGPEPASVEFSMHINPEYLLAALGAAQGGESLRFKDLGAAPVNDEGLLVMSPELWAVVMPRRP